MQVGRKLERCGHSTLKQERTTNISSAVRSDPVVVRSAVGYSAAVPPPTSCREPSVPRRACRRAFPLRAAAPARRGAACARRDATQRRSERLDAARCRTTARRHLLLRRGGALLGAARRAAAFASVQPERFAAAAATQAAAAAAATLTAYRWRCGAHARRAYDVGAVRRRRSAAAGAAPPRARLNGRGSSGCGSGARAAGGLKGYRQR